jgi:hypothetical protein
MMMMMMMIVCDCEVRKAATELNKILKTCDMKISTISPE